MQIVKKMIAPAVSITLTDYFSASPNSTIICIPSNCASKDISISYFRIKFCPSANELAYGKSFYVGKNLYRLHNPNSQNDI